MFQPSKALKWINQPLPLNHRQSQQLLTLLTTSFRQQLGKEHGFQEDQHGKSHAKLTAKSNSTGSLPTTGHRRRGSDSHESYTDTHMRSILTNPLLNTTPTGSSMQRNPMEVFEQAVSRGMMTIDYASACLAETRRRIVQSPVLSIQEGMAASGAGRKVLKWLLSSGIAKDNNFLENSQFAATLIEFLVAERLQEYIWPWIKRSFQYAQAEGLGTAVAARQGVLMQLVVNEVEIAQGLEAAIASLRRAAQLLEDFPEGLQRGLLGLPGQYLLKRIVFKGTCQPPSELAFDAFTEMMPLIINASTKSQICMAQLSLKHPSRPEPSLALDLLRSFDKKGTLEEMKVAQRPQYIQLGLETAKLLLENDQGVDAAWVLDHLQTHCSKWLGLEDSKQVEQAKAEASSLRLLDSLSFA